MAGALGFADSHAPGFWEALTQAVADQRTETEERTNAAAEQAAAERAEQLKQAILDAATYGRIEVTHGRVTSFTELIPPASGDIIDGTILIRVGTDEVAADGTKTVITKYLKAHSTDSAGVVVSKVKDNIETITKVIEHEPGSIDVKVGDSRPVRRRLLVRGKKPHTFDPKADGSLGRASGGQHVTAAAASVVIEVSDDGRGGATLERGLRGLSDRAEALGGVLTVDSPTGTSEVGACSDVCSPPSE